MDQLPALHMTMWAIFAYVWHYREEKSKVVTASAKNNNNNNKKTMVVFIAALAKLNSRKQMQFNHTGILVCSKTCDRLGRLFLIFSHIRF